MPDCLKRGAGRRRASLATAATGFPSPSCRRHVFDMPWGGVRGGGNRRHRKFCNPATRSLPHLGEGTLRPAPRLTDVVPGLRHEESMTMQNLHLSKSPVAKAEMLIRRP